MYSAILIDDEPLTTQAVRALLEEQFTEVSVAAVTTNGRKAWELIQQQQPDFIVSDIRMPELDGMQLLQKIREAHLPIQVLLVSAFGEFTYAQNAISLGASGYLLKPFNRKEFANEITKVLHTVDRQRKELRYKHHVANVFPLAEQSILGKQLIGKLEAERLGEFMEIMEGKWDHCLVGLYKIRGEPPHGKVQIEEITKISIIEELERTLVGSGLSGVAFFLREDEVILMLSMQKVSTPLPALEASLRQIGLKVLNKYISEPISFGCCKRSYALPLLPDAYDEALTQASSSGEAFTSVRTAEASIMVSQQESIVNEALKYCKSHYHTDISLDRTAEHLHISKYYLCDLFKKQVNLTFWEYITQLRINHAKRLLVAGNLKVSEIAPQIGYLNASHFGRIFKEMIGCTPAEYRRNRESGS